MPPKARKRVSKAQMMKMMHGAGFFQDVGNFFTRTIPSAAKTVYNKALKPAGNWIKDQKVISKVGNALGSVLPGPAGTVAKGIGGVAGAVGLGKRRRGRKRVMRGSGMRTQLNESAGASVVRF